MFEMGRLKKVIISKDGRSFPQGDMIGGEYVRFDHQNDKGDQFNPER